MQMGIVVQPLVRLCGCGGGVVELKVRACTLKLGARVEFRRVTSIRNCFNATRTIHNS